MERREKGREWLTDKEGSSAAKGASECGRCRFVDRGGEAEERVAGRGDVSKARRGSVRGNPSFSKTDEVGMERASDVKDLGWVFRL